MCFRLNTLVHTAQKMKCSIYLSGKCDQIRKKMRLWSHLLKKSLMENVICAATFINLSSSTNFDHEVMPLT